MKKIMLMICGLIGIMSFAHGFAAKGNEIKVGTIDGPETQLMEVARDVAWKRYGLKIKIISFSDYNTPNAALNDGSLDANVFQHIPYLESQIKNQGYRLAVVGKTFVYPMGVYSANYQSLKQIPAGVQVAVPNDPSNEARALLLLEKAHLIKLKQGKELNATPVDVIDNPLHFRFIELDAAQLPRALKDVALAVINTNFAIAAGLSPTRNALFREDKDSPYANVVVVRSDNQQDLRFKQLVDALHSPEVLAKAQQLFGEGAIPAF